jgi:hypothetical protein
MTKKKKKLGPKTLSRPLRSSKGSSYSRNAVIYQSLGDAMTQSLPVETP